MATVDERISALKEKLKQEQAKKASIEARKRAAEAKKSRAHATRKKILMGSMLEARMALGKLAESKLNAMMDEYLTRADDRALFGLPIAEVSDAVTAQADVTLPKQDLERLTRS